MRLIATLLLALAVVSAAAAPMLTARATITTAGQTQTYAGSKCIPALSGFRLIMGKLTGSAVLLSSVRAAADQRPPPRCSRRCPLRRQVLRLAERSDHAQEARHDRDFLGHVDIGRRIVPAKRSAAEPSARLRRPVHVDEKLRERAWRCSSVLRVRRRRVREFATRPTRARATSSRARATLHRRRQQRLPCAAAA